MLVDSEDFVGASLTFWQSYRRILVDRFLEALVVEAKRYNKSNASEVMRATRDMEARSKLQVVARVAALASSTIEKEFNVIKSVVLSSVVDFPRLVSVYNEEAGDEVDLFEVVDLQNHLGQSDITQRVVHVKNEKAVWASRRMNPSLSRSIGIGVGAESVIDTLSSLEINDDGVSNEAATFFCPVGSHIDALPGSDAFLVEAINQRVVWLRELQDAAETILASIEPGNAEPRGLQILSLIHI